MDLLTHFHITEDPVSLDEAVSKVRDPRAGAIVLFVGTVRNQSHGEDVSHLDYEAYDEMVCEQLEEMASDIAEKWPDVVGMSVIHRTGKVDVGELSMVIAVSAPHRKEAFKACHHVLERLKQELAVWKKEHLEGGEVWVGMGAG